MKTKILNGFSSMLLSKPDRAAALGFLKTTRKVVTGVRLTAKATGSAGVGSTGGERKGKISEAKGGTANPNRTEEPIPIFHWAETFCKWLDSKNILSGFDRVVRGFFRINYSICPNAKVVEILVDYFKRWISRIGAAKIRNMIVTGKGSLDPILVRGILQELYRPIWWKIQNPDKGFFEFQRKYRGIEMTFGSRLIADLILEEWPSLELPLFGDLDVRIIPDDKGWKTMLESSDYGQILLELVELEFKDYEACALFSVLKKESGLKIGPYTGERQVMTYIPCLGDMFFYYYTLELTNFVYVINNPKWNRYSLAFNAFMYTQVVDDNGSPVGRPYPLLVKTVTLQPDGSRTEKEELMDDRASPKDLITTEQLRGTYEYYSKWDIGNLQELFWVIFTGSNALFPDVAINWKGQPGGGNTGPGKEPPGSSGPSGRSASSKGKERVDSDTATTTPESSGSGGTTSVEGGTESRALVVQRLERLYNEGRNLVKEGMSSGVSELVAQGAQIQIDASDVADIVLGGAGLLPGILGQGARAVRGAKNLLTGKRKSKSGK